jgi:hypothetical protein
MPEPIEAFNARVKADARKVLGIDNPNKTAHDLLERAIYHLANARYERDELKKVIDDMTDAGLISPGQRRAVVLIKTLDDNTCSPDCPQLRPECVYGQTSNNDQGNRSRHIMCWIGERAALVPSPPKENT